MNHFYQTLFDQQKNLLDNSENPDEQTKILETILQLTENYRDLMEYRPLNRDIGL
jgi:hypothetical protein